jgi:hypothetical protein
MMTVIDKPSIEKRENSFLLAFRETLTYKNQGLYLFYWKAPDNYK